MPRYINPKTTKHGTVVITTVQSVSWSGSVSRIRASGDADKYTTFVARGVESVSGSITLQDPNQIIALKDAAAADLTVVLDGGGVNDDKLVTILNVQFFDNGYGQGHEAVGSGTLGFEGFVPEGATGTPHLTAIGAVA